MLRGELLFSQVLSGRAERSVELAQDMTSRCRRVPLLAATLRAAAVREISLRQDLDAFTRPGYRLFALNLATGQEFHLGFLPAEGPLTLSNVALADGDYEIRLRSDGGYWCDARHATAFPLSIQDGEVVAPLPPITNLRYTRVGDAILLSWTWHPTPGMQTPRDCAIWTSPSQPVDITGEPDHVVPVLHPGGYSTTLPGTPPFHAAIRSRRDDRAGPVATITIHAPSPPPASPKNQTARFDRQ